MLEIGIADLREPDKLPPCPTDRTQIDDEDTVLQIASRFRVLPMVAVTDYIGGDERPNEQISAAFIKLQAITKQAHAFGYTPAGAETVLFFGGRGCDGQDSEAVFGKLVDMGCPVLYDNCYGHELAAAVKDRHLTRSIMTGGQLTIGKGPFTGELDKLTASRMVHDSCMEFAKVASGGEHRPFVSGNPAEAIRSIVAIATMGRRNWNMEVPNWQRREFDLAASNHDFLENAVTNALRGKMGRISCEIDDLTRIWADICRRRHVRFSFIEDGDMPFATNINVGADGFKYVQDIIETARDIGIGDAVDTYYAGVPASDIVG